MKKLLVFTVVIALLVSSISIFSSCTIFKKVRPDEFYLSVEKDFNDDGSSIDRLSAGVTWKLGSEVTKKERRESTDEKGGKRNE